MAPRMPTVYFDDIVERHAPVFEVRNDRNLRNREMSVTDLLANYPLHVAVERFGWTAIVERLREPGAQLASRDENNDTCLHRAFLYKVADEYIDAMVSSYLQETAENLVDSDGLSYFHIACGRCKLEHVKEFLSRSNVDINSQIRNDARTVYAYKGFSALHLAVEYGKYEVAAYLLANNASIYAQDENGTTPLHLACYNEDVKMIDLLLPYDRAYDNIIDKYNMSHFIAACMGTNPHIVEQYILAHQRHKILPATLVSE